jgi:hypothetical protein
VTIARARELLGDKVKGKSDDEIEDIINMMGLVADIIIPQAMRAQKKEK